MVLAIDNSSFSAIVNRQERPFYTHPRYVLCCFTFCTGWMQGCRRRGQGSLLLLSVKTNVLSEKIARMMWASAQLGGGTAPVAPPSTIMVTDWYNRIYKSWKKFYMENLLIVSELFNCLKYSKVLFCNRTCHQFDTLICSVHNLLFVWNYVVFFQRALQSVATNGNCWHLVTITLCVCETLYLKWHVGVI